MPSRETPRNEGTPQDTSRAADVVLLNWRSMIRTSGRGFGNNRLEPFDLRLISRSIVAKSGPSGSSSSEYSVLTGPMRPWTSPSFTFMSRRRERWPSECVREAPGSLGSTRAQVWALSSPKESLPRREPAQIFRLVGVGLSNFQSAEENPPAPTGPLLNLE